MSNPKFVQGPVTCKVNAESIDKYRLVKLTSDGIEYAGAEAPVFGAVTEAGAKTTEREPGDLRFGRPDVLAVHTAPAVVPVACDAPESVKAGAAVYAAADGKVSDSGSVVVGVALSDGAEGAATVDVRLLAPVAK
ncbi:hypothetical protein CCICO_04385 [Corynebacterium ciconiae DSM 44920]|uniref:capsid cement protein n=1 Tax=Corynebacterium ciconiae TaxID=227319 RepID=UPI00037661E3|nr:capsid cement protein [Corynebacterium ciconiae]WKD60914.1 hypothetical protein CCICO_04385 [Corynebacterium ciconiae DSM 44920]